MRLEPAVGLRDVASRVMDRARRIPREPRGHCTGGCFLSVVRRGPSPGRSRLARECPQILGAPTHDSSPPRLFSLRRGGTEGLASARARPLSRMRNPVGPPRTDGGNRRGRQEGRPAPHRGDGTDRRRYDVPHRLDGCRVELVRRAAEPDDPGVGARRDLRGHCAVRGRGTCQCLGKPDEPARAAPPRDRFSDGSKCGAIVLPPTRRVETNSRRAPGRSRTYPAPSLWDGPDISLVNRPWSADPRPSTGRSRSGPRPKARCVRSEANSTHAGSRSSYPACPSDSFSR